jgi:hypothetical protein
METEYGYLCPHCGQVYDPIRYRWVCVNCGVKTPCCEGAPLPASTKNSDPEEDT